MSKDKRGSRPSRAGKGAATDPAEKAIRSTFKEAAREPVPKSTVDAAKRLDRLIDGKRRPKAVPPASRGKRQA